MSAFKKENEIYLIYLCKQAIQAVYKGKALVWEAVSRLWKGNQSWKGSEPWKY